MKFYCFGLIVAAIAPLAVVANRNIRGSKLDTNGEINEFLDYYRILGVGSIVDKADAKAPASKDGDKEAKMGKSMKSKKEKSEKTSKEKLLKKEKGGKESKGKSGEKKKVNQFLSLSRYFSFFCFFFLIS
jgi:hypothetical protein